MNIKRLLYSNFGRIIISILLGVGLASLFYRACKDKDCLEFRGPIIKDVDGKIFKHGEQCYKYDLQSVSCDNTKKIIPFNFDETYTENVQNKKKHPKKLKKNIKRH